MLITLAALSEKIDPVDAPPEFKLKDLIAQSEDTGHVQSFEPMKRKVKVKKPRNETTEASGESDNNAETKKDDMSRFD